MDLARKIWILLIIGVTSFCLVACSQQQTGAELVTDRQVVFVNPTATQEPYAPNLFTTINVEAGAISPELVELAAVVPIEEDQKELLLGKEFVTSDSFVDISTLILNNQVPVANVFASSPCGTLSVYQSGGFSWEAGMSWQLSNGATNPYYHPGLDMVCDRDVNPNAAPILTTAPAVVLKAYTYLPLPADDSVVYWSSGGTAILLTQLVSSKLPSDVLTQAGLDMQEYVYIVHVYGHMSSLFIVAGQQLNQGDALGIQGNTGRSYGTHVHYGTYLYNSQTGNLFAIHPSLTA